MRKNFLYSLFIVLTSFLLVSCEDEVSVDLDRGEPQFTIDAILTDKKSEQIIRISKSIQFFDNSGLFPPVSVDSVVLEDQSGKKFYFIENTPGTYTFNPAGADTFSVGNEYSLTVYHKTDIYQARSKMNRSTPIDSITYEFIEGGGFGGNTTGYFVFLNAVDQLGVGDCYWIRTYRNGNFLNRPSEINTAFDASGPGAASDGLAFIFPIAFLGLNDFQNPYQLGDKVKVEILGITRSFYEFLNEAQTQIQNGGLFAPPPANVRTNFTVNNKNAPAPVGFFNICGFEELEITIE
jgi:hypothetical protein